MEYRSLQKLFYQDKERYYTVYQQRFDSEYAVHLDFDIKGSPAFFVPTPKVISMLTDILRMNKSVSKLCMTLPGAAINQFSRRCLIDEIVLTNRIEGVHSTRKEISDVLDELESRSKGKRFYGLVQKYTMLMTKETLPLNTCQDVRMIYDELVLQEVSREDPDNIPDGRWFRKGPVSIYSPAQREIHKGAYPEEKIIEGMEKALAFLQQDSCEILYRIAIFHYLFEYIHPFYDGNGRLGRFICSYLLSKELEPVIGYRISYTIQEHITDYYRAFAVCNDPLNKGELTPFLEMFLKIVRISMEKLNESLQQRFEDLERYRRAIPKLVDDDDWKLCELYDLLIQAALFSEFGVPTSIALKHLDISRGTLNRKLDKIPKDLLRKEARGSSNYYSIRLEQLKAKLA